MQNPSHSAMHESDNKDHTNPACGYIGKIHNLCRRNRCPSRPLCSRCKEKRVGS